MNCPLPLGIDGPAQLDFGLSVETLAAPDLLALPHLRCQHSQESVTSLVRQYRETHGDELATGVVFLGAGADREVYSLPCGFHVLKLDKGRHRYGNQTSYEVSVWEDCPDELRPYLCPLDAWGDGWAVARRAECDDDEELAREVSDRVRWSGVRDVHSGNVGRLNGRPVIVDYGYPGEGDTYMLSSDARDSDCGCSECNPRSMSGSDHGSDCDCSHCRLGSF